MTAREQRYLVQIDRRLPLVIAEEMEAAHANLAEVTTAWVRAGSAAWTDGHTDDIYRDLYDGGARQVSIT